MTVLGILPKMIIRDGTWALKEVSKSILTTDRMISRGRYKNFPGVEWAVTIGLLMTAWSAGVTIMGILPKRIIRDGTWAVKEVAKSIVSTGYIFTKNAGVFKNGPTKEWAEGVSLAIGAFGQVYSLIIQAGAVNAIFGGKIKPSDFGVAIKTISNGIVEAAKFFGDPKLAAVWKPGPTKEWAEGIGIAIGAFSPVYGMLLENAPGFLSKGGGVGPEDFAKAVVAVSHGIIAAAGVFEKSASKFEEGKYPSVKWGQGVGAALKAFAPVFKSLSEDTGMMTSGDEVIKNMTKGITALARAIVSVGKIFEWSKLKWDGYPTKKWAWNVGLSIRSYSKLVTDLGEDVLSMDLRGPALVATSMSAVGKIISKNSKYFNTKIDPNFMKSVSSNLFYYMAVAKKLQSKQSGLNSFMKGMSKGDPMSNMASGMIKLANAYNKLASSIIKMGGAMNSINDKKLSQMERISQLKMSGDSKGRFSSIGSTTMGGGGGSSTTTSGNMVSVQTNSKNTKPAEKLRQGKHGDLHTQNDKIIELLKELNDKVGPGSNIDTVMVDKLSKNKDNKLQ
jgi:hypothetical protein